MRLTDAQLRLQDRARRFALDEVLPTADRLDPEHAEIPAELLDRLAGSAGSASPCRPTLGGQGLGMVEYCLVSEELARAWMSVGSVIAYTNGSTTALAGHPRERELVARMARGEFIPAFALTEPEAGSDAASLSCAAERDGDGWRITGRKRWCGFALNADAILLYARSSPPQGSRSSGISSFLVEKPRGTFPDGLAGRPIPKIGYFGITSWELDFDGLRLPADALIGAEGAAFAMGMEELNRARMQTAARSIGCARGALEDAAAYAAARRQFGRALDEFQAIRFRLAEMATQVAASPQPDVCGRRADRRRRVRHGRSVDGQAARQRDGRVGNQRGPADPRRQRVHHGARGRAALARRPPDPDHRGHLQIQKHIIARQLLDGSGR